MTTEPKFIPEEGVKIQLDDNAVMNVRLIDCVGYIVPSSIGYIENEAPRMVVTPWFENEVPFNMAAEVGTQKVITEHSTIGLVITTDGSISDIPRSEYEEAEERVINELKDISKPFIILLNCVNPNSAASKTLAEGMSEKYGVPVMAVSCVDLTESDIRNILTKVLFEFPIKEISVDMPKWITTLEKGHWLKESVYDSVKKSACSINHISEVNRITKDISECEYVTRANIDNIDLGNGCARISLNIKSEQFYKILGEATGLEINGESELMPTMIQLAKMKKEFIYLLALKKNLKNFRVPCKRWTQPDTESSCRRLTSFLWKNRKLSNKAENTAFD